MLTTKLNNNYFRCYENSQKGFWSLYYLAAISIITLSGIISSLQPVACSQAMKRLYEDLFTDYNRLILPVAKNKTKVTVTLGLKLGQILDLNLKQQILSTNVWVEQTWHDYKLQWEPQLYDGIDMIHVPAENIWIPDIVLFNNADGNYELTLVAKARLFSNGTVVWKPPTMFRSTCEIDVEYFPFDIQTCFLRFGSWTYAGDEVEIRHVDNKTKAEIGIDLSQFYKNVEWDIIDVPAYYNEVYYECCQEPFPDVTFQIVIRRKMLFYLVNLILPVALMTFMTVSVFYLPSDSNEKVTLSISILTSLIVFFLLMLEIIPASSLAVPLFGKYLLFTLALVSLSACVSVYVLNLHHRSPSVHSMSPRVRQIFLKTLPRLLRLDRPDPRERSSLNRFRRKKIEQQKSMNKVYDLTQPLAASLNLIETLHKSYDSNAVKRDGRKSTFGSDDSDGIMKPDNDDEGRYFRRYVDDYINKLKNQQQQGSSSDGKPSDCNCEFRFSANNNTGNKQGQTGCCEHNRCCPRANQPLQKQAPQQHHSHNQQQPYSRQTSQRSGQAASCCSVAGGIGASITVAAVSAAAQRGTTSSSCANCGSISQRSMSTRCTSSHQQGVVSRQESCCKSASYGCIGLQSQGHAGMLNDDTLDLTFDYDDQETNTGAGFLAPPGKLVVTGSTVQDNLPSPPPPPRQLAQITDSMHNKGSGRVSSCSKNFSIINDGSDELSNCNGPPGIASLSGPDQMNHGQLVDKLINSINLINNASDEIDTTTTASNGNDHEYDGGEDEDYSRVANEVIADNFKSNSVGNRISAAHQRQQTNSSATMYSTSKQHPHRQQLEFLPPTPMAFIEQQRRAAPFVFAGSGSVNNNFMDPSDKSSETTGGSQDNSDRNASDDTECCQLRHRQSGNSRMEQESPTVAGQKVNNSQSLASFEQRHYYHHHQQQQLNPNSTTADSNNSSAKFKCICNQTSQTFNNDLRQQLRKELPAPPPLDSQTNLPTAQQQQTNRINYNRDALTGLDIRQPSDLLLSLRLSYDQMPAHIRAAIRSILFIADTIKNEDDENSAIEDWESMSMVVDRLFLWIFFLLCTFGSIIILALAPSLYDQRASIDDKLRIDIPPSNCSASVNAHH